MIDLVCRKSIQIDRLGFSKSGIGICTRNILSPESECWTNSFTQIKPGKYLFTSIINRYQETSLHNSSSSFKPIMVTSIILLHFSKTFFAFPHRSLYIFFSLFSHDSNSPPDELISNSWHRDMNIVFISKFLIYHDI